VPPAIILLSFLPCPPLLLSSPLLSSKPNFATLDDYASLLHHSRLLLLAHKERERGGGEQKKQTSKVSHFLSASLLRRLSPHCDQQKEKNMKPTHSIKRKGTGKKILREKPKQDDNAAKEENQPTTRHQKNPKKQTQTHTHTHTHTQITKM